MNELVLSRELITSRFVAEMTGKQHKNVMRDIRDEIVQIGEEAAKEFFTPSTYINSQNKIMPMYELTKIGFFQTVARYNSEARAVLFRKLELPRNVLDDIIDLFDAEDLPQDRFIYVAQESESGRYKIGISKDPVRRIKELNIGNPEELVLMGIYKAQDKKHLSETKVHNKLVEYQLRSEWFNPDTPVDTVEDIINQ